MNEISLKTVNLCKTYTEGKIKTEVLKGIDIEIRQNELTAIIGKSGSGKSTLLHILGTLDEPTSGQILFGGTDLTSLSNTQKAAFRNQSLGFVYQFHHLLGDFTAKENIMMPLLIGGKSKAEADKTALAYLDKVGLSERANYLPSELSGGERQRVAIARALCGNPAVVLADEPTGNLDAQNAAQIFELFSALTRDQHTAVVMVTHDEALAARCDRIYKIADGRIAHE